MPTKTKPPTRPEETVPAEFRIIEADGESDFALIAATDSEESGESPLRRFTMTAYTGGKLILPNFPHPVVVDLSGLRIPAKSRPILRDHSLAQIVGHTEAIDINRSALRLTGVLSGSNTHTREVAESSHNGFPWRASIGAQATRMAFVDEREAVEVNGRRFTGPLYVARQSVLREVSFVALGADDRTSASLAASHSDRVSNSGRSPWIGTVVVWRLRCNLRGFRVFLPRWKGSQPTAVRNADQSAGTWNPAAV